MSSSVAYFSVVNGLPFEATVNPAGEDCAVYRTQAFTLAIGEKKTGLAIYVNNDCHRDWGYQYFQVPIDANGFSGYLAITLNIAWNGDLVSGTPENCAVSKQGDGSYLVQIGKSY